MFARKLSSLSLPSSSMSDRAVHGDERREALVVLADEDPQGGLRHEGESLPERLRTMRQS